MFFEYSSLEVRMYIMQKEKFMMIGYHRKSKAISTFIGTLET
jgi:hypothetical protein